MALWRLGRTHRWISWALPVAILLSAGWAVAILDRAPTYLPWLRWVIVGAAALSIAGLWLGAQLRRKAVVTVAALFGCVALFAGPAAYSLTTVNTSYQGSIVLAGPTTANAGPGGAGAGAVGGPVSGGGPGGRSTITTDSPLVDYLEANKGDATFIVAAFSSHSSAAIIIDTDEPVMTIGGFNGGDPAPTLEQFQQLVAEGDVRYVLVSQGGRGGPGGGPGGAGPGGAGGSSGITSWVTANGTVVDAAVYGGSTANGTLYDLAGATA